MTQRPLADEGTATPCASAEQTLLVVQPDSPDRTCVRKALERRGYQVALADGRAEAGVAIADSDVTLVFVDLDSWEIDPLGARASASETRIPARSSFTPPWSARSSARSRTRCASSKRRSRTRARP